MSDPAPPTGTTPAGYTDLEMIGRGGFASVYRAHQPAYDRTVAIKVLDVGFADETSRRRFERECAATGRVSSHPNIVTVLDAGVTAQGHPYLVMEHCAGGSFAARLEARGPLPVDEVLRVGVKIAGALQAAHDVGITHRDVKPENILVTAYGEPALADFGIAVVADRQTASASMAAFTPSHVPPEVLQGRPADVAGDVYSLASSLYALLAGHAPFDIGEEPTPASVVYHVVNTPPPPIVRSDVPTALRTVLARALAKDPTMRFASAAELGRALQAVQRERGEAVSEMVIPPVAAGVAAGVAEGAVAAAGPAEAEPAAVAAVAAQTVAPMGSLPGVPPVPPPPPPIAAPATATEPHRRGWLVALAVLAVLGLLTAAALLLTRDGNGDDEVVSGPSSSDPATDEPATATSGTAAQPPVTDSTAVTVAPTVPPAQATVPPTQATAPPTPTQTSPTVGSTETTGTTVPYADLCPNPEGCATSFVEAWVADDTETANRIAQPDAVSTLWAAYLPRGAGWSLTSSEGAMGTIYCRFSAPGVPDTIVVAVANQIPVVVTDVLLDA
ncbi:MAG: serine/threonine protein kinase [Acidimicrobiales bacterium]|jgi:hypothetical protein|nr:serine/threonine protein kinase [Acidimicrobiales bacterium]